MFNRKFVFVLSGVAVAVTTVCILCLSRHKNENETPDICQDVLSTDASQNLPDEENSYFVIAGDGVLCVYSCTDTTQILTDAITYIDLYSVASETKKSLEAGIMFESRTEVIRFIENISS